MRPYSQRIQRGVSAQYIRRCLAQQNDRDVSSAYKLIDPDREKMTYIQSRLLNLDHSNVNTGCIVKGCNLYDSCCRYWLSVMAENIVTGSFKIYPTGLHRHLYSKLRMIPSEFSSEKLE